MRILIVVLASLAVSGPGWSMPLTGSPPLLHSMPVAAAQIAGAQPDGSLGVCCRGDDCLVLTEVACLAMGGEWDGSTCDCFTHNCLSPGAAPCCIPQWYQCLILPEQECAELGGFWLPDHFRCERPDPCIQCAMPCCFGIDQCLILSEENCLEREGIWIFDETATCDVCADYTPQACCIDGECILMWESYHCANRCGVFLPGVYSCDPNPCEPTGIDPDSEPETQRCLSLAAIPNPMSGSVVLRYELPTCDQIAIDIFDPAGRCVRRLLRAEANAGPNAASWEGCDDSGVPVSAGAYLCRLTAGGHSKSTLVIVLNR